MDDDPVESLAGDGGVHGFAAAGKHRRSPVEHGEKPNKLRKGDGEVISYWLFVIRTLNPVF
jgi:hypothetical protein